MELTEQKKKEIDAMPYVALLRKWRFAPAGDPMFQGGTGAYFQKRMSEMRAAPGGDEEHVAASKRIGW